MTLMALSIPMTLNMLRIKVSKLLSFTKIADQETDETKEPQFPINALFYTYD